MIKYFHFLDKTTGEYFSVAGENVYSAKTIASENFDNPVFCGILDEDEINMLKEDVYGLLLNCHFSWRA